MSPLEPGGCTAFCSHSNRNMLTRLKERLQLPLTHPGNPGGQGGTAGRQSDCGRGGARLRAEQAGRRELRQLRQPRGGDWPAAVGGG